MKRFGVMFELIFNDDSGLAFAGGCGWSETYVILASVFAADEKRALALLKLWIPRGAKTNPRNLEDSFGVLEADNVSEREGVLFYSKELISRKPYTS